MRTILFSLFAGLALALPAPAADDLSTLLQKGLFEEEANQNLDAAIKAYQAVVARHDEGRKFAATAVFRLGECYRKLGKTNEAVAQFQRILTEFGDQPTLLNLSRQNLAVLGASTGNLTALALSKTAQQEQRRLLEEQIKLVESDIARLKKMREVGVVGEESLTAQQRELLKLKFQLAGLADGSPETAGTPATAAGTDEEEKEIRRIQEMIRNSPDLINAPTAPGGLPLIAAANRGQMRVTQFLLDNGADVNRRADNGDFALLSAAENGHKAMVELLLARGAAVNAKNSSQRTALHVTAEKGYRSVAEVLLVKGADANAADAKGNTPLHLAAEKAHAELVQLLLEHGAAVNAQNAQNQYGQTPLILAAQRGHQALVTALLAAKADPNLVDANGRTALSLAAGNGHTETVKALLTAKADPNAGRMDLPLAVACNLEGTNLASQLLHAGADPNRQATVTFGVNSSGRGFGGGSKLSNLTPLQIAVAKDRADLARIFFQFKADPKAKRPQAEAPLVSETYGNTDLLKAFLDAGADPNADGGDANYPLLYVAAVNGIASSVEALLAAGAHVNPPADARDTPLHAAVQKGDEKSIRLLLDAGAEVNRRNRAGLTPLLLAVRDRNTAVTALLLAHGANPNLATLDNGYTPLHLAIAYESRPLAQLLLTNKADVNLRNKDGQTPLDLAKTKLAPQGGPRMPGFPSAVPFGVSGIPPMSVPFQERTPRSEEPASPAALADLLRQNGAVDDLPRTDRIEVRRLSTGYSATVFTRGTNDWNRFTLLELLARQYRLLSLDPLPPSVTHKSGSGQMMSESVWGGIELAFPDLKNVLIRRPKPDGKGRTEIKVDVEAILKTGDCAKDPWLEWGDIVEVPEADHPVSVKWEGPGVEPLAALLKCVSRTLEISIKGAATNVTLSPSLGPNRGGLGGLWDRTTADFMLVPALEETQLLRASSDLSSVRVKRRDPATGEIRERVFDCSNRYTLPDFWLRDGDAIEVPEK